MAISTEETTLAQRLATETTSSHSINNTVKIAGETYEFSRREFPLGFSMIIPSNFKPLAIEYARKKYPYENRPHTIMSNVDTTVNLAFDTGGTLKNDYDDRLTQYKGVIKRLHPSDAFYVSYIAMSEEGSKIGCYDFRNPALDGDIYSFNFFMDMPDGELLGWFTCPSQLQKKWEPLIREMVKTIRVMSEHN